MKEFTSLFIKQHRHYLCKMLDALLEAREISKQSEQYKHLYNNYVTNITASGEFILRVINGRHHIKANYIEHAPIVPTARCKAISKLTGRWVHGDILQIENQVQIIDDDLQYHEVESTTVCQFFSKYDINHKEVYTGDIILHTSTTCNTHYVVCYDVDSAAFVGKNEITGTIYIADILRSSEVVGNIHIVNDIDPDRI